ncbi:UbiA family prenyltransferase [Streptomyces liangshanensis]|uniref:UbiA family prenyltransferase n=1 Tax=Streptomyces liangshanensis TaxID=2717324 RepID=A0A6G9GSA8_9ACTN|nr:UbiA family prenyltransferase [Streptomyces liangshanensis]QIQ00959.1 UbiA family prenyltransferase [Streptomyces liangshanensis]
MTAEGGGAGEPVVVQRPVRGGLLLSHARTWRVYESATYGLLGLAGAYAGGVGAGRAPGAGALLGVWGVCTLGGIGGAYLGDYLGRDIDAAGKPHRPIPSGALRPSHALAAAVVCIATALVWALLLDWRAPVVLAGAFGLHLVYHRRLKTAGLVGDVTEGTATLAGLVLFGAAAVHEPASPAVWPVAGAAAVHGTLYNLFLAIGDAEGDRLARCLTLPVRRGSRVATTVAAMLVVPWLGAVWWAAAAAGPVPGAATAAAWLCLALATACDGVSVARLVRQARAPGGPPRRSALFAAESNLAARSLAACAYLFLAGGAAAGSVAAVAVLLVVLAAGRHQMTRYELGVPPAGPG